MQNAFPLKPNVQWQTVDLTILLMWFIKYNLNVLFLDHNKQILNIKVYLISMFQHGSSNSVWDLSWTIVFTIKEKPSLTGNWTQNSLKIFEQAHALPSELSRFFERPSFLSLSFVLSRYFTFKDIHGLPGDSDPSRWRWSSIFGKADARSDSHLWLSSLIIFGEMKS